MGLVDHRHAAAQTELAHRAMLDRQHGQQRLVAGAGAGIGQKSLAPAELSKISGKAGHCNSSKVSPKNDRAACAEAPPSRRRTPDGGMPPDTGLP